MSDQEVVTLVEPLIRHRAFASAEEAVRQLVLDFILRRIDQYRERLSVFEKRYGMPFEQFSAYLKERTVLLADNHLDPAQKQRVAQAVMAEEDDWLDWKIARDFLQEWLGVRAEVVA